MNQSSLFVKKAGPTDDVYRQLMTLAIDVGLEPHKVSTWGPTAAFLIKASLPKKMVGLGQYAKNPIPNILSGGRLTGPLGAAGGIIRNSFMNHNALRYK